MIPKHWERAQWIKRSKHSNKKQTDSSFNTEKNTLQHGYFEIVYVYFHIYIYCRYAHTIPVGILLSFVGFLFHSYVCFHGFFLSFSFQYYGFPLFILVCVDIFDSRLVFVLYSEFKKHYAGKTVSLTHSVSVLFQISMHSYQTLIVICMRLNR